MATTDIRRRALIDFEQLFLNGAGRTGRARFAIGLSVLVAALALFERITPDPVLHWTGWAADIVLAFAACAVVSKRLHDLGLAGWWTAFGLLAFVNVWPEPQGLGWVFLVLLAAAAAWLASVPGQRGFNRYGPPADGEAGGG